MTSLPLDVSASAVFADDGNGSSVASVQLGPNIYAVSWDVKSTVVSTDSTQQQFGPSTCTLYRGSQSPSRIVDATYSGDQDTSDTAYQLINNGSLIAVWAGGDIGSNATIMLSGTVNTGRAV